MLQHLQILNSKSSNLNGLMGFDGNHLGLLLKRRRERLQLEDKVVAEQVKEVKKVYSRDGDGYDTRVSRESNWYYAYVGPRSKLCMNPLKKNGRNLEANIECQWYDIEELMVEIRQDDWFALMRRRMLLETLGYLWTYSCSGAFGISVEDGLPTT